MRLKSRFRILLVALLVGLLATATVGTALADPPHPPGRPDKSGAGNGPIVAGTQTADSSHAAKGRDKDAGDLDVASLAKRRGFFGTVVSNDTADKKIVVAVRVADDTKDVDVSYDDSTVCKKPKAGKIDCSTIAAGDRVAVNLKHDTHTARHINVLPVKPEVRHAHQVGVVTGLTDSSITIKLRNGEAKTFQEVKGVDIDPDSATLQQGSFVTLILNRDGQVTEIVVHKKTPPNWPTS
ncbi:MAG: hypothetical protein HY677_06770 [Chloroflexi bacterium]|nr:hypothetical protein [Chloroflexota bacterium]